VPESAAVPFEILLKSTFRPFEPGNPSAESHTMPEEPKQKNVTYADAGVDISSGDRAKERIK